MAGLAGPFVVVRALGLAVFFGGDLRLTSPLLAVRSEATPPGAHPVHLLLSAASPGSNDPDAVEPLWAYRAATTTRRRGDSSSTGCAEPPLIDADGHSL